MKDEELEKLRRHYEDIHLASVTGYNAGIVISLCLCVIILGCLYLIK